MLKDIDLDELVTRAQSNDEASFTEICRRFTGLVKKHACQAHLASIREDALAEGWLAVAEAVKSYDSSRRIKFAGYVESRVRYAIWNLFKKERRKWQREVASIASQDDEEIDIFAAIPVEDAELNNLPDRLDSGQRMRKIRESLLALSPGQQTAIDLTVFGELTLKQAAEQIGVTPQAVFNLQRRGLKKLREKLVDVG